MSQHDARLLEHIDALAQAGTDLEAFLVAIDAVRRDPNLSSAARNAIWKTLARDQTIHYLTAITGRMPELDVNP